MEASWSAMLDLSVVDDEDANWPHWEIMWGVITLEGEREGKGRGGSLREFAREESLTLLNKLENLSAAEARWCKPKGLLIKIKEIEILRQENNSKSGMRNFLS